MLYWEEQGKELNLMHLITSLTIFIERMEAKQEHIFIIMIVGLFPNNGQVRILYAATSHNRIVYVRRDERG